MQLMTTCAQPAVPLVELVLAGLANSDFFQVMAKTLKDDLGSAKLELNIARKDVRNYTHLADNLGTASMVDKAVHHSLLLAFALGYGNTFVPSLVEEQVQHTGAKLVQRQGLACRPKP